MISGNTRVINLEIVIWDIHLSKSPSKLLRSC